jgi:NAD(P)-dependent dehydrogenase (short-subunit alcohol dehydrogenase family)
MSYSDLKGKTFVITGAASGMGRLIADLLAEQGANVGLLDLHKPTKAAEEVEQLGGGKALAVACNVQNAQEVDAAVAAVRERFGEIHGAANMAGILGNQGLKGKGFALDVVKDNDWDSIVNTNLDGVKNCLRAEMNNMKTGGSIVNAASVAGQKAFAYMGPYCVSKFGVIGLTKVAAQEFGTRGIRINAVAP